MRSLEDAARRLVEFHEHDDAPPVEIIERRGRRARRARSLRNSSVIAVVVALIAGVVFVATRPNGGTERVVADSLPSKPAVAPRARLDSQLAAHLGVGVPSGWSPIDFGNARLWAPPGTTLLPDGVGCGSQFQGAKIVFAPNAGCEGHPWLTMTPYTGEALPAHPVHTTVHGYALYAGKGSATSSWYNVPSLGVKISVNNRLALGDRIIETLAPSSASVMLRADAAVPTTGWRAVNYRGVSFLAPPSWSVRDLAGSFGGCYPENATVDVGTPEMVPSCPASFRSQPPVDNLTFSTTQSGEKGTFVHVGGITLLRLGAEFESYNSVTFHIPGTAIDVTARGARDGRVVATMLRSIRITHDPTFSIEGCPTSLPALRHGQRPGTNTQLVPGQPATLWSCRYHGSRVRGATPGALAAGATARPTTLQFVLQRIQALPPGTVPPSHCPADDGAAVLLQFGYPSGPPLDVVYSHLRACYRLDNGDIVRQLPTAEIEPAMLGVSGDAYCTVTSSGTACGP
jgi:hypothetical protein